MIPGMDNIQKNYYLQKYEITVKVLTKSTLCYYWLIQIITVVFRQLCTMKYAHMNKVFQYIENNKNNEISLSELAEEAGISSGYLSRIFKKYYKISVVDYIHLRKLLQANIICSNKRDEYFDISFLLLDTVKLDGKIFKKYEGQDTVSIYKIHFDFASR
ncbi:MAG: helix-turn-helix domain-containing protein [Anaerobutyricum sp.]